MAFARKTHAVFPFSFDVVTKEFVILLGEPRHGDRSLRDFGGQAASASETPVQIAARCTHLNASGLLGFKKHISNALTVKLRVRVPGQGFAYLLAVTPETARTLPMVHDSVRRCAMAQSASAEDSAETLFPFRKVEWLPLRDDLEIVPPFGKRTLRLNPITREALRHIVANFVLNRDKQVVHKRTLPMKRARDSEDYLPPPAESPTASPSAVSIATEEEGEAENEG